MPIVSFTFGALAFPPVLRGALLSAAAGALFASGAGGVGLFAAGAGGVGLFAAGAGGVGLLKDGGVGLSCAAAGSLLSAAAVSSF